MGQRSLGVDVGSHTLKAVLVESGWLGSRVLAVREVPLDERPLQRALTELLVELGESPHTFCVGLDRGTALHRVVQLPFSEPRKVRQAAPFAAEEVLPMNLEKVRVAHLPARNTKGALFDVPIFAVPLTMVEGRHSLRTETGATPLLQLDSVAVVEALLSSPQAPRKDEIVMVVDVGGRSTNLEVVNREGLLTSRSLRIGSSRMAAAAAPHLEAEGSQLEKAFLESFKGETRPSNEALQAVHGVFEDLAREIKQTLGTCRSEGWTISRLVLTGGGARVWDLPTFLAEQLKLSVMVLQLPEVSEVCPRSPERFSTAYGLALVACDRGRVSLDFLPEGRRSAWEDPFAVGILCLGVLLAGTSLAGKLWLRSVGLEERIASSSARTRATLERVGPAQTGPLGPRIEKMQRLLGAFRSSGRSPLKVLDAVSESVPIQGGLRFETFKLDRDTVYIEAKAESFLPAEDFEAALREHPGFEGVELKGQKTGASGGSPAGSLFVITATLKPEVF